jgi:3'-phosphoadenosine 5'-phosphosulfate (PAPS) 3'-phosphatase
LLYRAVAGQGAWRDDQPWHPLPPAADWHPLPLYLFCDCTFECHPQRGSILQKMQALSQQLGFAELKVKMGGGGVLNACWALEHAAACYFKQPKLESGGGSFWDFAATACLFHEVGAVATDFQGDDLELNRVDSTFMNHRGVLYATHPQLAVSIREYFA